MMLIVTLLSVVPMTVSTTTVPDCYHIDPDQLSTNEFSIPLDPHKLLTGIVTIEGKLNPNKAPDRGTASAVLQFIMDRDPNGDEPIMEIETQVGRNDHAVDIRGALKDDGGRTRFYPTSIASEKEYLKHPNASAEGRFWVYQDNDVRLQISDLDLETRGNYLVYAGEPGDPASKFTFNYGSEENWKKFNDRRLSKTRMIRKKDEHGVLSVFKLIVCHDPQPQLQDNTKYEIIKVAVGMTITLSCSASGAPYLTSLWRDGLGGIIDMDTNIDEVAMDDGSDYQLESTLKIEILNDSYAGDYSCTIFNQNFGTIYSVEKRVRLRIDCDEESPSVSDSDIRGFKTCRSCAWRSILSSIGGLMAGFMIACVLVHYDCIPCIVQTSEKGFEKIKRPAS